jgi:type IV secretory pathway VirJ component
MVILKPVALLTCLTLCSAAAFQVQTNPAPQHPAASENPVAHAMPVATTGPADIGDLPVMEVPAAAPQGDTFALLITGDGGYAAIDQALAAGLAASGRPVAALNSLRYFWKERTPQQVADDVSRMIEHYAALWGRQRVVLVGYSQGADVMPFVLNRLPAASRSRVAAAATIGLSDSAVFEFHVANWLTDPKGTPTMPELLKLRGMMLTCIYGADDGNSVCAKLPAGIARTVRLDGGHQFDGDYKAVTRAVLEAVRTR